MTNMSQDTIKSGRIGQPGVHPTPPSRCDNRPLLGYNECIGMTQPPLGLQTLIATLSSSTIVSPYVVLGIAGLFVVVGVILVLLFEYHWKAYAIDKLEMLRVRLWYYVGTAVFGSGMVISALVYVLQT
jgi:hypothetical protein